MEGAVAEGRCERDKLPMKPASSAKWQLGLRGAGKLPDSPQAGRPIGTLPRSCAARPAPRGN